MSKEQIEAFQIIDLLEDLLIVFDKEFKIRYVNPSYCSFFSKKAKDLIGKEFFSLILESDRPRVLESLLKISSRQKAVSHQERVCSNKTIKWLEWKVRGHFNLLGKFQYYLATGRDITQQKKLESELLLINQRHEEAEKIAKVGNWEYNIKTGDFWGSKGAKKLYGFPETTITLTTDEVESCIPDRDNVHKALIDLIEKNTPYDLEFEIHPIDNGKPRIINSKAVVYRDQKGIPEKVVGVVQDVTVRHQSQKELKKREQKYRYLIETASDAIYLIDQDGTIVETNHTACEMLGKSKEEIQSSTIGDIDRNFPLNDFLNYWKNIDYGKTNIFETTHTHKDGHQIPIEISGIKFQFQDNTLYYGIARDITERIAAENKLKASEERFKLAVEGTKDGLWDWDLRTNEAYHSDRFATMLGYEPDELPYTEKAWSDLLHPDDKAKAYKNVDDYLNRRVPEYKSTFRMRCKDGYYRWISGRGKAVFDEHGKPYRFVGFNSDITSRKNAERAFIESEEKYHRLYDTMAEGVIFINREGLIIEANPAAQKILGLSNLQLKDNTLYDDLLITFSRNGRICDKEDHPLMQSLSKGVFINDAVIKFHNLKSKKTKWLSISSAPLYDKDEHKPSRAYAVFSDITDRIASENELRKLNDMLISAQEIAKLGYWSYDLKNKQFIWSQQMFSITGRDNSPEVPSAHELKSILSPESVKIFEEAKSAILKGKSYNIVLKVNIPDQNIKYILLQGSPRIDSKGEVYELFGTAQDISEMKFTQIELEKHRDHLEELVKERTEELEKKNLDLVRYNKLFIGREFRIKELRQDIKALKQEIIELKKH